MATVLDNLLNGFRVEAARDWLRQMFSSYDPSIKLALALDRNNKNEGAYFAKVASLGVITKLSESDGSQATRPLVVVAVEMKENLTERTSRAIQFRLAKRLLTECAHQAIPGVQAVITQGLFFFYTADGTAYRLSLVSGDFSKRTLKLNDAKRQSFFVDTQKANNVIRRRFAAKITTYQALLEAFSVESLTDEFYKRLFTWFCWATDATTNVTYPNDLNKDDDNRASLNEGIIRLITRLMFVWFVRQKNLIPFQLFDEKALASLLKDFDRESMEADNYYRCILQNLFFATLNCPVERRKFQRIYNGMSNERGVKTCYRYDQEFDNPEAFKQLLCHVPFLNCSLFECLDRTTEEGKQLYFDGFSGHKKHRAHVPNGLFFKKEHLYTYRDEKGKEHQVPVSGLIHLFNQFDFTVDENLHNDADIVLDPELLGKVFENLLGAYDPESGANMRSSTGSFYTPREIVNYMVESSLREYLKRQVPFLCEKEELLDALFDESDEAKPLNLNSELTSQILNALYNCKIFDPACGSGAFPMGVLQMMVRLLHRLDPYNIEQIKRIEAAYKESNAELETERNDTERAERAKLLQQQRDEGRTFPDYARKLYLIENCIYGADIQPIAVQIAKLRFFISLLCDQLKQNWDPEKENYGFLALPNLETKFVCANTLLHLPKLDTGWLALATGDIKELRLALQKNRRKLFYARTSTTKEKYRQKDKELRDSIRDVVHASGVKPDEGLIATQTAILKKLQAEYETVKDPNFVEYSYQDEDLFGSKSELPLKRQIDINKSKRDEITRLMDVAEKKIKAERNKGQNKGSTALDEIAHRVASWDPYDQNATADFFDPFWMFNLENGFDIVIGNPPYVQLQKMEKRIVGRYENDGYQTFTKTGDLYCLFYERGVELLKEKALLSYITSNKWMRAGYGEQLRGFFADCTNPLQLLDFAGTKIFPGATVDTNILMTAREANEEMTQILGFKDAEKEVLANLFGYVRQHHAVTSFTTNSSWAILSAVAQSVKTKVESVGVPLEKWNIEINYGIKTGFNDAFFVSTETRNEILANCQTADERKRTEAIIRPLIRGRDVVSYGVEWADLWLINTHNGVKGVLPPVKIEECPSIKSHLDKYWAKISKRADKGKTPYNLRNCAYLEDFTSPKIIYPNMTKYMPFYYDENGYFTNQKCFIIVGKHLSYLTAFFNSSLFKFCFRDSFPELLGGTRELSKIFFDKIPVRDVSDEVDAQFKTLVDDIQAEYTVEKAKKIDNLIFDLYQLTPEERAAIGFIDYHNEPEEPAKEIPPKKSGKAKPKGTTAKPVERPTSPDEEDYLE